MRVYRRRLEEGDKLTAQSAALQPVRTLVDIIVADGGSSAGATSPTALAGRVRALLTSRDAKRGLSVHRTRADPERPDASLTAG